MQRIPLKHQEYVQTSDWVENTRQMEREGMTDGACVLAGGYGWVLDGGYMVLANFGDTICYALQEHISDRLNTYEAQSQLDPSDEKRRALLLVAEQALDELLGSFLENGYQKGMKEQLQEIVNAAKTALEIDFIWVLPDDLEALFSRVHPFADYDAYENEEEAEANEMVFDWHNPEHRIALVERILLRNC